MPCLVFKLLVTSNIVGPQFAKMAVLAVLVAAGMGLIARLVAVPLRLSRPELSAFLLVVMFSNGGNYGLPVVLFAFGPDALSYGTVFFVVGSLMTYTVGVFLAASGRGDARRALAGVVRVPAIYGVAAAAVVVATGLQLPLARDAADLAAERRGAADDAAGARDAARTGHPSAAPEGGLRRGRSVADRGATPGARAGVGAGADGHGASSRRRAGVDAGRRGHDDPGAGVRCVAGVRDQRRVSVHALEPVHADAVDCVSDGEAGWSR